MMFTTFSLLLESGPYLTKEVHGRFFGFNLGEYGSPEYIIGNADCIVIPGAGSLIEQMDKKIFVWLRDSRMYVGILRSVDLFANLVLHNTVERIQIGNEFGDVPQGIVVVRGENVALLGEVGEEKGDKHSATDLIATLAAKEKKKEEINKMKVQAYLRRGMIFTPEDYF